MKNLRNKFGRLVLSMQDVRNKEATEKYRMVKRHPDIVSGVESGNKNI